MKIMKVMKKWKMIMSGNNEIMMKNEEMKKERAKWQWIVMKMKNDNNEY